MRNPLLAVCALVATSALVLVSCQDAPESTPAAAPIDKATRATSFDNFARVVYVEVNDVNPLNAGEYLLSGGKPFFTHVILFASNIRGDANKNVHNYNNPNNAAILGNPAKYIKPLQNKGIKVIMGNLGDHTGAGFANLTAAQIASYTNDLVDYENIVDGYDFDDEWAEYGTRGYPNANNTSFSDMLISLNAKTDRLITVFDWGYTYTINAQAAACIDLAYQGGLNGYSENPYISGLPISRYCPYFIDLTNPDDELDVMYYVGSSAEANAGGVCFFNLPMQPTCLSTIDAAAQAFGLSVTHTGKTYSKDYGN